MPKQEPNQGRNEMQRMKTHDSSTAQMVKNEQQNVQQRLDKPVGNGKRVNSRQVMDSHKSGPQTRLRHHPLVLSQYRSGGPWIRGKKGYGLAVRRRGKPILGFMLKLFWEKCPTRMTYHLKEGKLSWNHQVHAIRISKREYPTFIQMGMPQRARKQK